MEDKYIILMSYEFYIFIKNGIAMALRSWFFIFLVNQVVLYAALPEAIKKEIEDFNNQQQLPGLAVAIYYKGEPYFLNFGYSHPAQGIKVTEDTLFDIASVTKCFVATVLAYQVIRNNMNLHDPLNMYFPALKYHTCALSTITLEQLATHTSGLPREASVEDQTERNVINSLLSWSPAYPPGTFYEYSNLGFRILRFAFENYENISFEEILEEVITRPLAMNSSFIHVPSELRDRFAQGFDKDGHILPEQHNIALKSTTADLMEFLRANLGLSMPVELYHAMQLAQKGVFQINPNLIQGLGWQNFFTEGLHMIEKNGGIPGFSSWLGWTTPENVGLVLLTNKTCSSLTKFARQLLTKLTNL